MQAFMPVTVEVPRVLLPLVNVPMIEYSLEWLAANRVEEVWPPSSCLAHPDLPSAEALIMC
jgi:translation initiation factor eIF-2B subunit epsilon